MEHRPWVPDSFAISSERILIVGHSHHKEAHVVDNPEFTIGCVRLAIRGAMQDRPFFARQPRYLSLGRHEYYNKVALMNFVPVALSDKYEEPEWPILEAGKDRFLRLLGELKPTHVFVLSSRLQFGRELPPTVEEQRGEALKVHTVSNGTFRWGSYVQGNATTMCARLPHPQSARTDFMQEAFRMMLDG